VRTCVSNRDTDPPIQKLLHAVGTLCINFYEACQRKNRANSWNDCHSRIECLDSKSVIKNLLGFRDSCVQFSNVIASVWVQAGEYLGLAAQIPAKQKSGCPRLHLSNTYTHVSACHMSLMSAPRPRPRPSAPRPSGEVDPRSILRCSPSHAVASTVTALREMRCKDRIPRGNQYQPSRPSLRHWT
jgi:hypothetical protein